MERAFGFAQQGAQAVHTMAYASHNVFQETWPLAQITVYNHSSTNLATIFSDNSATPLGNPFQANVNGWWWFYALDGRYDVLITPAPPHCPWWIRDILLADFAGGGGVAGSLIAGTAIALDTVTTPGAITIHNTAPAPTLIGGAGISIDTSVAGQATISGAAAASQIALSPDVYVWHNVQDAIEGLNNYANSLSVTINNLGNVVSNVGAFQTPWLQNIDAAGYALNNAASVNSITFGPGNRWSSGAIVTLGNGLNVYGGQSIYGNLVMGAGGNIQYNYGGGLASISQGPLNSITGVIDPFSIVSNANITLYPTNALSITSVSSDSDGIFAINGSQAGANWGWISFGIRQSWPYSPWIQGSGGNLYLQPSGGNVNLGGPLQVTSSAGASQIASFYSGGDATPSRVFIQKFNAIEGGIAYLAFSTSVFGWAWEERMRLSNAGLSIGGNLSVGGTPPNFVVTPTYSNMLVPFAVWPDGANVGFSSGTNGVTVYQLPQLDNQPWLNFSAALPDKPAPGITMGGIAFLNTDIPGDPLTTDKAVAQIRYSLDWYGANGPNNGQLSFLTMRNGVGLERVRIFSGGRVFITPDADSQPFTIYSNGMEVSGFAESTHQWGKAGWACANDAGESAYMFMGGSGFATVTVGLANNYNIYCTQDIVFHSNTVPPFSGERMRISADGNVYLTGDIVTQDGSGRANFSTGWSALDGSAIIIGAPKLGPGWNYAGQPAETMFSAILWAVDSEGWAMYSLGSASPGHPTPVWPFTPGSIVFQRISNTAIYWAIEPTATGVNWHIGSTFALGGVTQLQVHGNADISGDLTVRTMPSTDPGPGSRKLWVDGSGFVRWTS